MDEVRAVYGIIGWPLEHTLSPVMHNAAFRALDVDAVYEVFPLLPDAFDRFFTDLKGPDSPIFGLNVTVPYKERVIPYLDTLSPLAQKINAVNTVVITKERKLIGYNTDAPGFMSHLVELGFNPAGKRVAIMGAGGSARAILATLCMIPDRPESVRIYNRSTGRLTRLVEELSQLFDLSIVEMVDNAEDLNIELCDLLINTTSVGLKEEDPLLINPDCLHSNLLVYDLIYNPPVTPLLKAAHEREAKIANGLGMLFYQGVLAFQHWSNMQLEDDIKVIMRRSLEEALKK
jgi:shikimate dehydrogenase